MASHNGDEADFRFSNIYYTRVGFYKGRLFAMRKISCGHIDITRSIKKELKVMEMETKREKCSQKKHFALGDERFETR